MQDGDQIPYYSQTFSSVIRGHSAKKTYGFVETYGECENI